MLDVIPTAGLILELKECLWKIKVIQQCCAGQPSREGTPGLQDLAIALPRLDQVFTTAQIKHKLKALHNSKDDQCCAIIKLEKEITQVS